MDTKRVDFNIDGVLRDALRKMQVHVRLREAAVWRVWDRVVGETVAQQAQPASVRRGILFVTCSSPVWMQQLQFMKGVILEKLKQHLEKKVIKDIRFQIGVVSHGARETLGAAQPEVDLNEDEWQWVDEVMSPLRDTELQEIVKRIMVKDTMLKKKGRGTV